MAIHHCGVRLMDCSDPEPASRPDDRIAALINEYFDRRQAGEEITVESFAAEHPELAEELTPYLEGLSILGGLSAPGPADVDIDDTATEESVLPTIGGYVLHEEIGRGGMGVVYKALQVSTKRIVALKVMLAGPFASASVRRRFKREIELAARLQHPNIVRVLESGRVERQRYYAMDYVEGAPLDRHLAAARPDRKAIVRLFTRICDAVDYAHGHGVIHRDLKPANILVDDEGAPHILDFGLAKPIEEAGREATFATGVSTPGQIMGTLPYLSPEQAAEEPGEVDARTDVYALGVMLYEALTGALPYDVTGRLSEIIRRIVEDPPRHPSSSPGWRDGELDAIVLKALEKEKDRRYQSAQELGADLHRYLEGEPILARPPGRLYVLRKKLRRHRIAVGLSAGAALAALLLIVVLIGEAQQRHASLLEARRTAIDIQGALETGTASHAEPDAEALIAQYPALPEANLVYAHALFRTEQQEAALVYLERAIRQERIGWEGKFLLAGMHRAMGDPQRAEMMQKEGERDFPHTADAWYLRSFSSLELGEVRRCAEEAVAAAPSNVLAWRRAASLRRRTGDLDGALDAAHRLLTLGEDVCEWTAFKGDALALAGRLREAIEQYDAVDRLGGDQDPIRRSRAFAYRRLGEYAKAVGDYSTVIERASEAAAAVWDHYQRATPLWILDRREEAVEDYRRVRSLLGRPTFADARQFLILRELGRADEARRVLDAALLDVQDDWLRQVLRCLAGEVTPAQLVADAEGRGNIEQLCEACYYAGEIALLAGDRAGARAFFQRCVQTGLAFDPDTNQLTPMNEFELARWRLASLSADDREEN